MTTCVNTQEQTCSSLAQDEEPDLRLGDVCLLCLCFSCDRCGQPINLDAENRLMTRGLVKFVCGSCLAAYEERDSLTNTLQKAELFRCQLVFSSSAWCTRSR